MSVATSTSTCTACRREITFDPDDLLWHDSDRLHSEVCGAPGEALHHEPTVTAAAVNIVGLGCRTCGRVIVQDDEGYWTSVDGIGCPGDSTGQHRPDHVTAVPPASEPDPDPDDPDETERLLTLAIAADWGFATITDPDTWQPPEDILERARERLRAWSEVRG